MDKKNTVIGVLLLIAAMVSFYLSAKYAPPPPKPAISTPPVASPVPKNQAPPAGPARSPADAAFAAGPKPAAVRTHVTLENDFVAVKFTNLGGAIEDIALKKQRAALDDSRPYMLNHAEAAQPALALAGWPGLDRDAPYELVSRTATEIVYRAVVDQRLEITRRYRIAPGPGNGIDPYQIRTETTFRNLTDQVQPLARAVLSLGTAAPLDADDSGLNLNVGYHDGKSAEFVKRGDLESSSGFFGMGAHDARPFIEKPAAVTWASVKNQFFTAILTPDEPGVGVRVERVKLERDRPDTDNAAFGVTGFAQFDLKPLAAGASATLGASYYAGPKEYRRLADTDHFKHDEDLVMEFGFFGFFAKLLLTIMTWVHSWMHVISPTWAWGWAVVITTLILKIVFVPFTLAASRSSKRMQKLMPAVQALREKHKDNPVKANEAMMKLYKENKVNPLGGCIPVLITIPFFIGFFSMLQSASELRFAAFLWAPDLSAPDTVARIFGLPLNIMPILMGATMIIQMRLTPTPTTDPAQAMMFKIMPWMFTAFCYTFSCALALYSFVNGAFTIGQQLVINRMPDPELPAVAGPDGKPAPKNVTPPGKRPKK
jgi:YidC/Oxa1 family membrane protein insertase